MDALTDAFAAWKESASDDTSSSSFKDWTRWNGPDVDLTVDQKVELSASVAEEIIRDKNELRALFERKRHPVCYDGFEPSGRMHIAQGLLRTLNVNRLTRSGVKFIFYVADYFALMNQKMGGDIEKIRDCGRYFVEIWKACGMEMTNVEFVWASAFINAHSERYWFNVLQIALHNSITRIKRCGQIMGREASDELMAAQIFYPCMQCNDVYMLKCDMTQLGVDQRKVNALAREYCVAKNNINGIFDHLKDDKGVVHKPVVLSHHMLASLKGDNKMSKSDPDAAIFMEDEAKDVDRKIRKAYCPEKKLEETTKDGTTKINGCMEYVRYIVLPMLNSMTIRFGKDGCDGEKTYKDYDVLEKDYLSGKIHPSDLKPALAAAINTLLEPVRKHFHSDATAKGLLAKMKVYMAERAAAKKKKTKKQKKTKTKKGGGPAHAVCVDMSNDAVITCLDLRVGQITAVKAITDTLYEETIDLGSQIGTRAVCSKLVGRVPIADMSGLCVVVTNLKARKMGPSRSEAMVLAAEDDKTVELLRPPAGAKPGDRVVVQDVDWYKTHGPATANKLNKGDGKKAYIALMSSPKDLRTDAKGVATWRGRAFGVEGVKGSVSVKTATDAGIH